MLEKTPIIRSYIEARERVEDGDIALYKPNWKLSSRLIARSGGTPYCHAGMVFWSHDHLLLLETLQFHGGHCVRMSRQVEQYKGQWDIYRVTNDDYDKDTTVKKMLEIIGEPYGWASLLQTGLTHLPLISRWYPVRMQDYLSDGFPHCAMGVSRAARIGGVDLCPERSDLYTEPGHIAKSKDTQYRFTLI